MRVGGWGATLETGNLRHCALRSGSSQAANGRNERASPCGVDKRCETGPIIVTITYRTAESVQSRRPNPAADAAGQYDRQPEIWAGDICRTLRV